MKNVKVEKILADYTALVEKKDKGLAAVETDAVAYAKAHGYDDEKTAKFVAFTQEIQGSGLAEIELAKLDILGEYIEEVPEVIEESVSEEKIEQTEPANIRLNVI